mgnify:CR=1 FL=1
MLELRKPQVFNHLYPKRFQKFDEIILIIVFLFYKFSSFFCMLRDIFIYQFYDKLFYITNTRKKEEEHVMVFQKIWKEIIKAAEETKIGSMSMFKFQYHYCYNPEFHITTFFITDLTDRANYVQRYLSIFHEEFIEKNREQLKNPFDSEKKQEKNLLIEGLDCVLDKMFEKLRPKVSIVGFSGVGKTTILHLIRDLEIPTEHIPTITGDRGRVKIGKLNFDFWDFAGQDEFKLLWTKFIKGSDAVLIITDSTRENCERSKEFIEIIQDYEPNARYCVIGNKQDLQDSIPIGEIEKIMKVKAYAMVASNPENRTKMINIIADLLEIDIEGLEVLNTLKLKDQYFANALAAIHAGDIPTAIIFLEKLIPVLTDMGDNSLANEISLTLQHLLMNENSTSNDSTAQLQLIMINTQSDQLQMIQNAIIELKQRFSLVEEKLSLMEFKLTLGQTLETPNSNEILKQIQDYSDKIIQLLLQLN